MVKGMKEEIIGVCSALFGLFLGLCLISYDKWDPSLFTFATGPAKNYGGIVGAYLADLFMMTLGWASYIVPVALVVYGVKRVLNRDKNRVQLMGAIILIISLSILLALFALSFKKEADPGGIFGHYAGRFLKSLFSIVGAYIIAIGGLLTSIILLSPVSIVSIIAGLVSREKGTEDEEAAANEENEYIDGDMDIVEESGPVSMPIVVEPPFDPPAPVAHADISAPAPAASGKGYEFPALNLLNSYDAVERPSKDALLESSALLEKKLNDFSVQGRVTQVHTGPLVALYEYEPAPGVKINRIASLSDDLALAMKAQSIRIATMPGKSTIGIEIPNESRETVALRDIISSDVFNKSKSPLTMALGKDIFGSPVVADLARMPHLLVAGATGSGKSVSVNSMVISMLYKATPDEVKTVMIDPKLLELSSYEGIPHLMAPVITQPKEAAEMLKMMVFEMERRYKVMYERGVRNIEGFNAAAPEEERLPYVVIFIDEFADLMLSSGGQVEDSITRLAQKARACGMHLIIATQRPSVDVITGLIKANFPARIAFRVTSRVDSRTILDVQGAEHLIGKGDMLMGLPGAKIMRVHGALVSEPEVREVVNFVKSQRSPDYAMLRQISEAEQTAAVEAEMAEERDDLYYKVIEFCETVGEVSISSIQRRFKIGYNKAANIMELLEQDGLVGPPKGAGKPRDFIRRPSSH